MKTIDELWYGNVSPFEQCTRGDKRLKELLKFELVLALKFELVLVQKIKLVLPLVPKCSQLRVVRKRFHLALVLVPE